MEIFKELYYGNVSEITRRRKKINKELSKKETLLYDTLCEKLSEDDKKLLDEFIDVCFEGLCDDLADKYEQGVKTGILMGVEDTKIELQ